jgi:hypothetical protein
MRNMQGTIVRLLGGVAIGAVSLAAASIATGGVAHAANGDPVILGQGNASQTTTFITAFGGDGLNVQTTNESGSGVAAKGGAFGVYGVSVNGQGVHGDGGTYGVQGSSGSGTGVYGVTQDNTRAGVFGENTAATNSGGAGVVGIAHNNLAVEGISANGTALEGISSNGTALSVGGVALFSRSGRATVPAGSKKIVVGNIKLGNGSMILALVQQTGAPAVKAAVPNVANNSFTIYLAKTASTMVVVAWFVLS